MYSMTITESKIVVFSGQFSVVIQWVLHGHSATLKRIYFVVCNLKSNTDLSNLLNYYLPSHNQCALGSIVEWCRAFPFVAFHHFLMFKCMLLLLTKCQIEFTT